MLIAIEGPEGSGKTTLLKNLLDRFNDEIQMGNPYKMPEIKHFRRPGNGAVGSALREIALHTEGMAPFTEALIMAADSAQLHHEVDDFNSSETLYLMDRADLSFYAYQGSRGIPLDFLVGLCDRANQGQRPDLYILLTVQVGMGIDRKKRQASRGEDKLSRFDLEDQDYLKAVEGAYRWIPRQLGLPFIEIDGGKDQDEVCQIAADAIVDLWNGYV